MPIDGPKPNPIDEIKKKEIIRQERADKRLAVSGKGLDCVQRVEVLFQLHNDFKQKADVDWTTPEACCDDDIVFRVSYPGVEKPITGTDIALLKNIYERAVHLCDKERKEQRWADPAEHELLVKAGVAQPMPNQK